MAAGVFDYLSVNFYANYESFEKLAKRLDDTQAAAAAGRIGDDVVTFGEHKFIVAERGARQGSGKKSVFMRWRMESDCGLTILLMNRATAHDTLSSVQAHWAWAHGF